MKCSLCGTDLIPGNNICPSCGSLNMTFEQSAPAANTTVNTSAMSEENGQVVQDEQVNINVQPLQEVQEEQPVLESTRVAEAPPVAVEELTNPIQEEMDTAKDISETSMPTQETVAADTPEVIEEYEDLDEGEAEVVNATADMAAPELAVEQENLSEGVRDISSSQDVSTYDPNQVVEEQETQEVNKEAGVNFQLPEVKEAEKDTQGMGIMEIETISKTAGQEGLPVREKFSLKILKKKTIPRNLVIILLVVFLAIGVLIGSTMFGKQVYTPTTTKKQVDKIPHVVDGKNNVTYAGKFIYKIPQEYDYDKSEGGIVIYGKSDEFKISIKAMQGSYNYIANAKESIIKSLGNVDVIVNNIKEEIFNEVKYIVIESTVGPRNRLYTIRDGINDYVFYAEIISSDNSYNYDAIDIVNDIVENVEYQEKYPTMEGVASQDVAKMIVTASEAHNNS